MAAMGRSVFHRRPSAHGRTETFARNAMLGLFYEIPMTVSRRPRRVQRTPRATRNDSSLDQLSQHPQRLRDGEPKRLRRFEIDDKLDLCWLLDRQIGRLGAV